MKRTIRKKLPSGFRHLFSPKEIKDIQEQTGIRFDQVSFGHLLNAATYQLEQAIQSSFHPISVSGHQKEGSWILQIHQSGFRKELLPDEQETNTKLKIVCVLSPYLLKVINSTETDLLRKPQLMVEVRISNNQVEIHTRESK